MCWESQTLPTGNSWWLILPLGPASHDMISLVSLLFLCPEFFSILLWTLCGGLDSGSPTSYLPGILGFRDLQSLAGLPPHTHLLPNTLFWGVSLALLVCKKKKKNWNENIQRIRKWWFCFQVLSKHYKINITNGITEVKMSLKIWRQSPKKPFKSSVFELICLIVSGIRG